MNDKPWQSKETLETLYHERGMTQSQMADELGCSKSCITKWMGKLDVTTRATRLDEYDGLTENNVKELYHNQEMSLRKVADEFGCSPSGLRRYMKKKGIETRDKSESAKVRGMPKELTNSGAPEWVYDQMRSEPANLTVCNGYLVWRVSGVNKYHAIGVHRLVAISDGADPNKVFDGNHHVHHENKHTCDNRPENLQLMEHSEHARHHMKDNPMFHETVSLA
jgi:predicted transcriptional regulator